MRSVCGIIFRVGSAVQDGWGWQVFRALPFSKIGEKEVLEGGVSVNPRKAAVDMAKAILRYEEAKDDA